MPESVYVPVDTNNNVVVNLNAQSLSSLKTTASVPSATTIYSEAAVSRTSNGSIGPFTWPANANQCFVGINVTGFAGGTNVVVSLQQQDGNGNYVTIGSSATITATGTYGFSVGQGLTNGNMIASGFGYQFTWTVTGTFSTLTFQIGAQAR